MSIATFQGLSECRGRNIIYKSSNKDMHNGLSVALGKLQYHHLNCHLLLKECYY